MTGTGKTTLGFHLVRTLHARGKPVLVFDWKRHYRSLRAFPDARDLRVYTVERAEEPFAFNLLVRPPGPGPGEWLAKLIDVLKHAYFVGEGVEYVLRRAINEVYEACGLYEGRVHDAPTFQHVRALVHVERLQGRMGLWKASTLRVLDSLCFPHGLGPVVNAPVPWPHEQHLSRMLVLELDALADADKGFLTEALIL